MEDLVLADNEIDSVLLCHDKPETELFKRYLEKKENEREAMVLALIGKILVRRSRRVKDVEFERKS